MKHLSPPCLMQGLTHWQAEHALLISDLHLSETSPIANKAFERLLSHASSYDSVCILGDLFEVYAGDDSVQENPHVQYIAQLIAQAAQSTRIAIMHGNRDFMMGDQWFKTTRSLFLQDPCILVDAKQGVATHVLSHGDSWCTLDTPYQHVKRTIRHVDWQAQMLAMPYAQRYQMAKQYREKSMSTKVDSAVELSQFDVQDVAVEHSLLQIMQAAPSYQQIDVLHGHTHRPGLHELAYQRYVLGDWSFDISPEHPNPLQQAIVAVYQQGKLQLQCFDGYTLQPNSPKKGVYD